ncbi:MAG TPA: POTRA domain-containing protein, partial [Labilithrix sp.]
PAGSMQEGKPFDGAAVKAFVNALTDAYKEHGFGGANVAVATDPAGEGRVRVRVTVDEGPKWTFGKIDFRGQSKAKEAELLSAAQLQTGSTFDEDVLERAALVVTAWYYDHGMVNAKVDAHVAKPGADGVVPITFTIQEGEVFSISTLGIDGVPAAEQKTLLAELKAKPKQTFVRATLVEDLQRVKARATALHPRADVEVEPMTELDPKTKTIALRFKVTVHEH